MLLVMSGPFIHAFPLPSFVPTSFVVFAASAALAEPRIKWEVINSLPLMPPPASLHPRLVDYSCAKDSSR